MSRKFSWYPTRKSNWELIVCKFCYNEEHLSVFLKQLGIDTVESPMRLNGKIPLTEPFKVRNV